MIDAGFFPKQIELTPVEIDLPGVREICSVSQCISSGPENWVDFWLHNDFGWFNSISEAVQVVPVNEVSKYRLFAYRIHPLIFTKGGRIPLVVPDNVHPETIPGEFQSLGFDSINKSMPSILGFECSPLSCNGMAEKITANMFGLFPGLKEAINGAELFANEQPEPGDYYVIEVLERKSGVA